MSSYYKKSSRSSKHKPLAYKQKQVATKKCVACGELIPIEAVKCSHCSHFQKGLFRNINPTVIALLIALLAVLINAFYVFWPLFEEQRSDLEFHPIICTDAFFEFSVFNKGNRVGKIRQIVLRFDAYIKGKHRADHNKIIIQFGNSQNYNNLVVNPREDKRLRLPVKDEFGSKNGWIASFNHDRQYIYSNVYDALLIKFFNGTNLARFSPSWNPFFAAKYYIRNNIIELECYASVIEYGGKSKVVEINNKYGSFDSDKRWNEDPEISYKNYVFNKSNHYIKYLLLQFMNYITHALW